ncbi:hypothetical protein AeRB84_014268, partial [Aphanomyces euteiches]
MPDSPKGKEISESFYKPLTDANHRAWNPQISKMICSCGNVQMKPTKGYTNLVQHIKKKHIDWRDVVEENRKNVAMTNRTIDEFLHLTPEANNMHKWLTWIVEDNLPFSFVEKPHTRSNVKLSPICRTTLTKYLQLVTTHVEKKIANILPDRFGIVIDGWTESSYHFLAVFASFPNADNSVSRPMLAFTTLLDQTNQSAANHAPQSKMFYSNNTNTMPLVAKLLQCPFIGCASHRLALHIKKAFAVPNEDNDDTPQNSINKVNRLMTKLKSANKAGALRYETHLKPVIRNVTRWSSTFAMIQRYNQLRDLIDRRDKELIPFLLTPNEDDEIELWEASLRRVNDITIALQSDKTTLFDARALLDGVVALNLPHADPTLHITRDAKIVKCVDFECGIVKVLGDREQDLTPAEKEQLEPFRSSNLDEATICYP